MRFGRFVIFALCTAFAFMSCIKDAPKNDECDIVSAWVEGDEYSAYFYQPSHMKIENISTGENEISFIVISLITFPDTIPVNFTITEGAVIEPPSGSMQNFKSAPVIYTVTSEDGKWQRKYTVKFQEFSMPSSTFSFEHVDVKTGQVGNNLYHEFYEEDANGNRLSIWASGNPGAVTIKLNSTPEEQPTYQCEVGYKGKGLCLNTQSAGELGEWMKKPIAAGNLYLGSFIFEEVMMNPLKATRFGIPYTESPVRITGWYKYKPGDTFTNAQKDPVPGKIDEADIYAVLYRNTDKDGNEVYLYGDDVLTSSYIVRKARVESLPPTDEWTQFEMFFDNGAVDYELLKNQGYNLTIVFTSSKDGASFEGAIGSTLYVDEVEIFFEELD